MVAKANTLECLQISQHNYLLVESESVGLKLPPQDLFKTPHLRDNQDLKLDIQSIHHLLNLSAQLAGC
jgi:hypothetical protein